MKKKQIAILGSTGSIGTQALKVIEEHPDLYEAYALTANNQVELLAEQARKFMPAAVVIANEAKYLQLKEMLADLPIQVYAGADALCEIVEAKPIDVVLVLSMMVVQVVSRFQLEVTPAASLKRDARRPAASFITGRHSSLPVILYSIPYEHIIWNPMSWLAYTLLRSASLRV